MVESSIPEDVLRAWLRSPLSTKDGSQEDPPKNKLDYLMTFMKSELDGEERSALAKTGFGSSIKEQEKKKGKIDKEYKRKDDFPTAAGLFSGQSPSCVFCEKSHLSQECIKAQSMLLKDKNEKIKLKRCCFNCLKPGHNSKTCRAAVKCVICSKKHYALMCPTLNSQKNQESKQSPPDEIKTGMTSHECSGEVLLQTLLVKLYSEDGNRHRIASRLLFDNGSQCTAVRRDLVNSLKLVPIDEVWSRKVLFGGTVTDRQKHHKFKLRISSLDDREQRTLLALDESDLCGRLPSILKVHGWGELSENRIWLTDINGRAENSEIEIIVGSDCYGKLMTGPIIQLNCGLTAMKTVFGWTLSGQLSSSGDTTSMSVLQNALLSCQSTISDLWRLDVLGIHDPVEVQNNREKDEAVRRHFQETVSRDNESRYSVKLPWLGEALCIPNNRSVAEKRLVSTTTKLHSANVFAEYDKIFQDWLKEGFIEKVEERVNESPIHYLPHRAVLKPDSLTTPKGPNLLELIPSILLRFRLSPIGATADIRKAFEMIGVDEEDRNYLRFLWWEDEEKKTIHTFRHRRVVLGVNCSPFLLDAVIDLHLKEVKDHRKQIAMKLLQALYVDNCVTSFNTIAEYEVFKTTSVQLLAEAKMELRQWECSSCQTEESPSEVNYKDETNVLGLKWNKREDTLHIHVPSTQELGKISKRAVLSQVQKIFDPLGYLSPATLIPKLILQQAWERKSSWDDELQEDLKKGFISWWSESLVLQHIAVPRNAFGRYDSEKSIQLHSFCDASKGAYAAAVFVRDQVGEEITVQLLQSKSRVAPIKTTTIPRLELLGCTLAARLTASVRESISMANVPTYYWSDSTTVLAWIRRNDEWGTFVGNRVREICQLSKSEQWAHVPGVINPADLPSRGCTPRQLLESRWWEGPEWLKNAPCEWPSSIPDPDETLVLAERKKGIVASMVAAEENCPWYVQRYSSYIKNLRQFTWILRFTSKCCNKSEETGDLTQREINEAEKTLFKIVQQEVFPKNEQVIAGLRVVVDDGLIRVKTKLLHRQDSELFRFPTLLPNSHPLVGQLILKEHITNGHAGVQFLMGRLREKIWVIQGRRAIRKIIARCVTCRRFTAKAPTVPPASLPKNRVKTASVFQTTGVDLAGPLFLKNGSKSWFAIFTCAVYRAIHLELVDALSTEALYRFINRRGRPSVISSDNGTNFVGADNLFSFLDWKKIEAETRVLRIQWRFNPPTAAWWGGWWERLIQSVKGLMKRMLGHWKLNYPQLLTCLCEVEATLNARPLTYVTEDQEDLIPLTPAMFLQDIQNTEFPESEFLDASELRGKYKNLKVLRDELRSRFRNEYLALLVQRGKTKKHEQFKLGDVVLVGADNKKRLEWPMGRVIALLPGRDEEVRLAKVKTSSGEFLRPLQRLYPLKFLQ